MDLIAVGVRVSNALNNYVDMKLSLQSWDEYKEFLNDTYFIAKTNEDGARSLAKSRAGSNTERTESIRKKVIIESLNNISPGHNYCFTAADKKLDLIILYFLVQKNKTCKRNTC